MAKNLKLKAARAVRDMTQADLAAAVGVSRQTINAIEKGEYNPTINLCRSICRVLGCVPVSGTVTLNRTRKPMPLCPSWAVLPCLCGGLSNLQSLAWALRRCRR